MFYVYRCIVKSSRASWGIELYVTYMTLFQDVRSLLGTSWELPYWKMNGADLKMYSMQAIQSFPVVDVLRFSVSQSSET